MRHETGHIINSDGHKLFTQQWLPDEDARRLVMIAHGYAEHSGRYDHVARALVDQGCAVYAMDHRGHGKSEGTRALFEDFENVVDDYLKFIDSVRPGAPFLPLYILGHSAGSLVALGCAYRRPEMLAGLILSGTAVNGGETVPSFLITVVGGLQRVAPKLRLIPGISSAEVTRDPDVIAARDADPLMDHGAWRLSTVYEIVAAGRRLRTRAAELKMPLLIMHGEADKVTPISGARLIYEGASSADKTIFTYPEMRHEVFNEIGRERVIADLTGWIDKH